jgi:hypothetical protein
MPEQSAKLVIDQDEHDVGDRECGQCWGGYPKDCPCGGLIHASFGDENSDGDYWLATRCDRCGEAE